MSNPKSQTANIKSATIIGLDAFLITVEVFATRGLPRETIVGLPGNVIKESKNRIHAAIINSNFTYPPKVFTINLAPAELPKEGATLDLSIAVGILASTHQIKNDTEAMYIGELSLTGEIKPVRGIISIALMAKEKGFKRLYIPLENAPLASLVTGLDIYPMSKLTDLHKTTDQLIKDPIPIPKIEFETTKQLNDYTEVKGQWAAKRILEIACAGNLNVLFIGSPGSGKSMLLKRLPTILPPLSQDQLLEVLRVQCIRPETKPQNYVASRPFKTPHHSISYAGLIGGGSNPKPGEISLAHQGILFLDELPEFNRQVLEVLRQPLEDHEITITRANYTVTYPAKFILAAAMNPCPCGYAYDPTQKCSCNPQQIAKYIKKISGPLLDRIDMIYEIPKLRNTDLLEKTSPLYDTYSSNAMQNRIIEARKFQHKRYNTEKTNNDLSVAEIEIYCKVPDAAKDLLATSINKGMISGRSFHKVLKVARTIADLEKVEDISLAHITEALNYRKTLLSKSV